MKPVSRPACYGSGYRFRVAAVLFCLLLSNPVAATFAGPHVDLVLVDKSEYKLYLMKSGKAVKIFRIALGAHPQGHKQQQGDERTPEGRYVLDYKNGASAFYKSIHISYPNEQDRAYARKNGLDPGGDIMIHGQKNGLGWLSFFTSHINWTDGCIAVSNKDMDEIWNAVNVGTPIEIRP